VLPIIVDIEGMSVMKRFLSYHDDHHREGQATVVTEASGPLAGARVVRGRSGVFLAHCIVVFFQDVGIYT
jgi:hypothetical protein